MSETIKGHMAIEKNLHDKLEKSGELEYLKEEIVKITNNLSIKPYFEVKEYT